MLQNKLNFSPIIDYVWCSSLLLWKGDGGEDVSCVLEDFHVDVTDTFNSGKFEQDYVDKFLDELKMFFVQGLVNPRLHMSERCFQEIEIIYLLLLSGFKWT